MRMHRILVVAALLVAAVGCSRSKNYAAPLPAGQVALVKITDPARIPDFRPAFANRTGLVESMDRSLEYFSKPSSKKYFPYLDVTHERAVQTLRDFKALISAAASEDEFHRRIVQEYDVYESVGCDQQGTVFFTGYFTPICDASPTRTGRFQYPLYKLPVDIVRTPEGETRGRRTKSGGLDPYFTRAELEKNHHLDGTELVYLGDKLDAYLIHVQGSAILRLTNGKMMEVGYAGDNGYDYKSLRDMLVKDGKIQESTASLATIKEYFKAHPEDLDFYTQQNDRFIFFVQNVGGPYGSIGVRVTPFRSIATDKREKPEPYPRGCIAFLQTKLPTRSADGVRKTDYSGFAMDQDSGGAIRAAGRADLYVGVGPDAEVLAGHTASEGRVYYIFVKEGLTKEPK